MAIIEAKKMYKKFGVGERALEVLHGIGLFRLMRGSFISIRQDPQAQENQQLMSILGCLDVPSSGDYFVEGINVAHMAPDDLAHIRNQKIGFIFQQFNLLPDLTALDNVALPQL